MSSSVRSKAITAGEGLGGGAVLRDRSARKRAFAGAAAVAASALCLASGLRLSSVLGLASVLELPSAFGLASDTTAGANRTVVGARDTDGVSAGPRATGCSTNACCSGSATGVTAGSVAVTGAGTSATRRSGASIRRSCPGKPKPGSPSPWPPNFRLNRDVCISSETSSAYVSRLLSGLARWLSRWARPAACGDPAGFGPEGGFGASLEAVELKRARPSLLGYCRHS